MAVGIASDLYAETLMLTQKGFLLPPRPKVLSFSSRSSQELLYEPPVVGATISTDRSTVSPGRTLPDNATVAGAPIALPSTNTRSWAEVQMRVPLSTRREVLVNLAPAAISVPSATVTSLTKPAALLGSTICVAVAVGTAVGTWVATTTVWLGVIWTGAGWVAVAAGVTCT